jgi:hypothetical protein
MSYEIVKGIKIDTQKNEVHLKSDSNNVYPREYTWWHCESLSKILEEQGKDAVEKEILEAYWSGNFQNSNNLYDKAVQYWKNKLPYTWDNVGGPGDIGTNKYGTIVKYTRDELKDALYQKYCEYKNRKKGNFFVKYNGHFVKKRSSRHIWYSASIKTAKRFNSKEDAMLYAKKISWDNAAEMVVTE